MKIFTKKRVVWGVVILAVLGGAGAYFKAKKNSGQSMQVEAVARQNLKQTVLATGQVVSGTDLSLGFKGSGIVQKVYVKEGDKVKAGAVLAALDQKDQSAALTSAQGALAQAKAGLQKILAGASNEDVAVAQRAVDAAQTALDNASSNLENVKKQQSVLAGNAYGTLLNSGLAAIPVTGNAGSETVTVSGFYTGTEQGQYKVTVYATGGGLKFHCEGLENADGKVDTVPQPLGSKGLYLQFSSSQVPANNAWTISIPNASASTYAASYAAYQAALQTQKVSVDTAQAQVSASQAALDQAQAALNLKKAAARPADIEAAQAQILSAQGQVEAAQASLENTFIRAPSDGTVTGVDVKAGEQATALKEAVVLQDVGNLHIEANVSEANIAQINAGQKVDVTFDALGPDRHFQAAVQTVNPASTVVSGVVNYKVTASLDNIGEIKPGMTANMSVLAGEKDGVLAVPSRAILTRNVASASSGAGSSAEKFVRVIDDPVKKTYHEVPVTTGMEADGGLVEITSGLNEGQEVVSYIKQ
ncbi:MAG: efflux RND transporter periplasmic adaptor subunit [Patescibacteria group bacterium]|nr:efflux RND transporter periplasmic adaptor subunit [Patescibacteria group bacterium]